MSENEIQKCLQEGAELINRGVFGLMERAQRRLIASNYSETEIEAAINDLNRAYKQRPEIDVQYALTALTNQYTAKLYAIRRKAKTKEDE